MLTLPEYGNRDATDLAELIQCGDISPTELAAAAHNAYVALNPRLNAVCEVYPERIQQPLVEDAGPLRGVPMMLKDAGSAERSKPQHCGSRLGVGYIATQEDPLIARFRQTGINIIGRTTTPELTMAATTESALYGNTSNPWSLRHSPGGSSGGSAAAVASGIVPLAHGTDVGGSIRIPAACCGIVGFKPTQSPRPLASSSYGGLLAEHVLTKSVRDAAYFNVAGATSQITSDWRQRKLRVAVWSTGAQTDISKVVTTVGETLASMGMHVEEANPTYDHAGWARADEAVWCMSTASEVDRLRAMTGRPPTAEYLEPPILQAVQSARQLTSADWHHAMQQFKTLRQELSQFFSRYDLLLSPTTTSTAPASGVLGSNKDISLQAFMQITGNFCPHTALFNVSKQPAISLPLGVLEDMPVGVQLVARPNADALLLEVSAALEAAMPWRHRLPPIHAAHAQSAE